MLTTSKNIDKIIIHVCIHLLKDALGFTNPIDPRLQVVLSLGYHSFLEESVLSEM